jgi:fatty-acyl-CoA synthase
MSSESPISHGLSLVHGPPLSEEPGLGALTLPGFLREVTARFADREALVMYRAGSVVRWRYEQLWQRARQVAQALVAIGVGKDSHVGILMTNRAEWLSATFGAWLAGAMAVPLSTFSTLAELDYLLHSSCVSVLMFEGSVLKKDFVSMLAELEPAVTTAAAGSLQSLKFPYLRYLAVVDAPAAGTIESWPQFLSRGSAVDPALVEARADAVQPTDTAALFFSSGSTARPKGIINAHRGIAIQFWRFARHSSLHEDARAWTPNGFFWSGNCATVLGATLACGGSNILQSTFNPREALELMQSERVNFPMVWPHQARLLEEASNWSDVDLSAMTYIDAANPLAAHPTIKLNGWSDPRHSYGSTETFTISTGYPNDVSASMAAESHGVALAGNTIKVIDPVTGEILPVGSQGEIAVKGPTLMMGYLGVPVEQTLDAEGFYSTGDAGYIDEAGRLYFQGRLTSVIKTGGANVSPLEVDHVLETFPGVKAVGTVGVPHDLLGEIVVACIVPLEGAVLDAATITAFAKERLASYKVPRRILFLDGSEIQLTGSSKIKPKELRKLATARIQAEAG